MKIETEINDEEARKSRLVTIHTELENTLSIFSKSLAKQTKLDNKDSLLNALKMNGLKFTAEKIKEFLPKQNETENCNNNLIRQTVPALSSKTVNKTVLYDDECEINRFQELFIQKEATSFQDSIDSFQEIASVSVEDLDNIELSDIFF